MDKGELQHKYHYKTPGKSFRWKKKIKYLILVIFVIGIIIWWKNKNVQDEIIVTEDNNIVTENEQTQNTTEDIKENFELCTVSEGDIPADIFSEYGKFDANDTMALLEAAEGVYDLTNLKIGQNLRFYFDDDSTKATRMEYDCNTEKKIVVERDGEEFSVREEKIEYDVKEVVASGTIDEFFYVDAMQSGLSEATTIEVADLFAFDVDFMTDIREGDSFVVAYEKRTLDGKDATDGKILAAKFVNDGQSYRAYYFDDEENDGAYYDSEGHELEKQFLKAPLSYRRISSTFTNARFHPITKKWTAHQQVDYAAPSGTPVVASANGVITSAGWSGGWGNMIRMKHDNGYTTHYGHLSGFAKGIKAGARVNRGDLIGFVGSTGWSTGPHLDYGMKQNGTPINPLSFVQPKGEPLSGELMKKFEEIKKQYVEILK